MNAGARKSTCLAVLALCAWFGCAKNEPATGGNDDDTGTGGKSTGGSGGKAPAGKGGAGGKTPTGSGGEAAGGAGGETPSGSGGSSAGGSSAGGSSAGGSGAGGDSAGGSGAGGSDEPDAGAGGAAGGSMGTGGTPVAGQGCAGVTGKLCEDFDKQTAGQEPKGMYTLKKSAAATMLVETSKPYSGAQSLHIHLTNPPADSSARLEFFSPLLPVPSNDIHGRAMVFLAKNVGNHWDLVTAFGTDKPVDDDAFTQYTLGSMGGHMMAVYQPGDDSVDSSTQFPVNRWACIQWEFMGAADGTHLLRFRVDGQLIDKGEITKGGIANKNWKPTTWKSMTFGWINFGNANSAVDMWVDDLAFGEQDIPCPPAK